MSNKIKKEYKNKMVNIPMFFDNTKEIKAVNGMAIVTNDSKGKTLSLCYGNVSLTIAFESIEEYFK